MYNCRASRIWHWCLVGCEYSQNISKIGVFFWPELLLYTDSLKYLMYCCSATASHLFLVVCCKLCVTICCSLQGDSCKPDETGALWWSFHYTAKYNWLLTYVSVLPKVHLFYGPSFCQSSMEVSVIRNHILTSFSCFFVFLILDSLSFSSQLRAW